VTWVRSPITTAPRILNRESDQETIYLEATPQNLLLTAVVLDADDNIDTVVIDLTTLNGDSAQIMYDDGINGGDVTAGDGVYSFTANVPLGAGSGTKTLTVTAIDADLQISQGQIILEAVVPGEIVWDNGGADSNWSTEENWNPDGVPGSGDRVAFNNHSSTDCVVDVSTIDVAALSINYGYTGTVTLSAASIPLASNEFTITGDLTVNAGTLLCVGDTTAINAASGGSVDDPHGEGIIINAPNITVGLNGKISADGQGFLSNQGPGAGEYANDQGAGGSYGGIGGDGSVAAHGSSYGSVSAPTALGSGGAYNWSGVDTYGGTGAGAIKLVVSSTLTVDGTVSANGDRYIAGRAGGGSGGSVWIIALTLAGSGSITADGGFGYASEGGGGAGGRIALDLDWNNRTFVGTIRAKGGTGWQAGHHGTIWVPADKWDELWNSTYHVNGSIALAPNSDADVPAEYSFVDLIIDGGHTLECQADNDGDPVNGSGVIINATNINIAATAAISADGLGFRSNEGPGVGEYANDQGSGGSHGGIGGDGIAAAHGSTYGSVSAPTALGSGGAYNWSGRTTLGGTGAGAIKLNVTDTLTVDGTVSADGGRYIGGRTGGGSGGSVWIDALTLAGSGSITADGGIGYATEGGGGAGGRIALQWTTTPRTFNGIIRAKGGTGWIAGHHGTIWVPSDKWNELWNATYPVNGSIALAPGEYTIAELNIDSGVTLECQGGEAGIVVDNVDATFDPEGTWTIGSNAGQYGNDIRWHEAGDGSATATWTPHIPEAGDYNVYAWWTTHPNRATNAKYIINHDEGAPDEVIVNQEVDGSQWNLLGQYYFDGTDDSVVLTSEGANEYIIADAIMIAKTPVGDEGDPLHGLGVIIKSDNITIASGAKISADGLGYEGPGVGESISDQGSGGSHGGIGGDGIAAAHGSTYGSVNEPLALGSGGAYNWGGFDTYGGTGAGAIKLDVSYTLTVNGTVSADGGRYIGGRTGGGSGGSVWIKTSTLAGSGSITADGGVGYATEGGGGGGGRIALEWDDRTFFDGTIRAEGGTGWLSGHHGTIWVPSDNWNELWDDTYHVNGSVALAPGVYDIDELHVDGGVTLECQGDTTAINEVSGGSPDNPHGSGVTINSDNIIIDATAAISADGLGFRCNEGPGAGTFINDQGAGGSHGGAGGDGVSAPAASTYGLDSEPTSLGSGGAYNWGGFDTYGGTGAGAINLNVTDTLTINGTVSANGGRYIGGHAGGGSGGSVWIDALILAGSGSIAADGGIGYATEGGGGGGGRIHVITTTTPTYTGVLTVLGGAGVDYGDEGSLLEQYP
jgi:hypothetical protein